MDIKEATDATCTTTASNSTTITDATYSNTVNYKLTD